MEGTQVAIAIIMRTKKKNPPFGQNLETEHHLLSLLQNDNKVVFDRNFSLKCFSVGHMNENVY